MFGIGTNGLLQRLIQVQEAQLRELQKLRADLGDLAGFLRRRLPLPQPGPLEIEMGEPTVANQIQYNVLLPALTDPHDVVSRELTIVVGGGPPDVRVAAPTDAKVEGLLAEQGLLVELSLVDIDDAGNRSASASTFSFTAADTMPPPTPGPLDVEVTGEV